MADLALTKYSGQLAAQLVTLRTSNALESAGQDARETTGFQRIGYLVANDGTTALCYYDPNTHTIFWDSGTPTINQQ